MGTDPFQLFDEWFAMARESEPNDANAMALATAGTDGGPHVRMVLMKGHGPAGFVFFTNEQSAKGEQLSDNPRVALLFHWKSLRRQVRIEGTVEPVSDEEADAYFATRHRASQIGAWASAQSEVVKDREQLERQFAESLATFGETDIPLPPHWGGYRVTPQTIEFWQGRRSRLHDRLRYSRVGEEWRIERLSP